MQDNETPVGASAEDAVSEAAQPTATNETGEESENQTENRTEDNSDTAAETNADQPAAPTPIEDAPAAAAAPEPPAEPEEEEEITYHAVQKEDSVTAIWEMQGRKHLRTIDPRSREGAEILRLFTAEEGEEAA